MTLVTWLVLIIIYLWIAGGAVIWACIEDEWAKPVDGWQPSHLRSELLVGKLACILLWPLLLLLGWALESFHLSEPQ